MQVTLAMSDLLLKSVDVMRAMLRAVQQKKPIDAQRVSDLQFDLELMIAQKNSLRPRLPPLPAPLRRAGCRRRRPAAAAPVPTRWEISSGPSPSCSPAATIRCACCASWRSWASSNRLPT